MVVVGVFSPIHPEFGASSSIGIGEEQQVDLVFVEDPGRIRICVVVGEETLGEPCQKLGRGALPGVEPGLDKEYGFGIGGGGRADTGGVTIGEFQDHQVVAREPGLPARVDLPGIADVDPLGQIGIAGDEVFDIGEGLVDGPITGQAHDAGFLTEK